MNRRELLLSTGALIATSRLALAADGDGISPNEAAEVGVVTMADEPADEAANADDEQVLVLA